MFARHRLSSFHSRTKNFLVAFLFLCESAEKETLIKVLQQVFFLSLFTLQSDITKPFDPMASRISKSFQKAKENSQKQRLCGAILPLMNVNCRWRETGTPTYIQIFATSQIRWFMQMQKVTFWKYPHIETRNQKL